MEVEKMLKEEMLEENEDGQTPLFDLVYCGYSGDPETPDKIKKYVGWGANINHIDKCGRNILTFACELCASVEVVETLIQLGVTSLENTGKPSSSYSYTPLQWACMHNKQDVVILLLSYGAKDLHREVAHQWRESIPPRDYETKWNWEQMMKAADEMKEERCKKENKSEI